jgi:uncharacterized membrane protein YhaH (DUF805 family)
MSSLLFTLAQYNSSGGSGGGAAAVGGIIVFLVFMLIYLAVVVVWIAGMWKTFAKGGQPGWAAIVPILNHYIMCKLVGRPGWWVLLMFIPVVNFVIYIILHLDIAKSFGKDALYGVGLALLPFIFFPMLGFGKAQYQGPSAV